MADERVPGVAGSSASADDAAALVEVAWAAEVGLRLAERGAALDAAERAVRRPGAPPPHGREPLSELRAERAIDAARLREVETALSLVDQVLGEDTSSEIARARACEARARALAFSGSDASVRRAERAFREAIDRYDALTASPWGAIAHEWRGYALFGLAYVVHGLSGRLAEARTLMEESLEQLDAASPRRPTVLDFYADALIACGDWDRAESAIDEGIRLATALDDRTAGPYLTWSRARIASQRGDAVETQRHLREAERDAGDWFETITGTTFLAEAAELLDRVGRPEEARRYLARAAERDAEDTFVRQAVAVLEARGGDPHLGIELLQELAGDRFLEVATQWRRTLLLAWATMRLGGADAGALAARALDQAEEAGGVRVALAQERDLVTALLPVAEAAGSAAARRLLAGDSPLVVRLLGPARVIGGDGTVTPLPAGRARELLLLLATSQAGVRTESVLERFFPDVAEDAARHRLRQLLTTIRGASGPLVERVADRLRLAPAWVDVRAFHQAADRARTARGARGASLARAAVAVWADAPENVAASIPGADDLLDDLRRRYVALLESIAADARSRGSSAEATAALSAAALADPDDETLPARLSALEAGR